MHYLTQYTLPEVVALCDVKLDDDRRAASLVRKNDGYGNSRLKSSDWDAGAGLPAYLDMLRHGWPEGAARMNAIAATNPPAPQFGQVMRYAHDFAGFRADVPRFIGGDMRCMIRKNPEFTPVPIRRIGFECGANWLVKADLLINRALAYCEFVDALDAAGIPCEVYGVFSVQVPDTGNTSADIILIKDAGQHLQRETFAATLGHPCFFRRLAFRLREVDRRAYNGDHPDSHAYGRSQTAAPEQLPDGLDVYSIPPLETLAACREALAACEPVRGCAV